MSLFALRVRRFCCPGPAAQPGYGLGLSRVIFLVMPRMLAPMCGAAGSAAACCGDHRRPMLGAVIAIASYPPVTTFEVDARRWQRLHVGRRVNPGIATLCRLDGSRRWRAGLASSCSERFHVDPG